MPLRRKSDPRFPSVSTGSDNAITSDRRKTDRANETETRKCRTGVRCRTGGELPRVEHANAVSLHTRIKSRKFFLVLEQRYGCANANYWQKCGNDEVLETQPREQSLCGNSTRLK